LDRCVIYSGVFNGLTTGTPIMMMVFNKNVRSRDYSNIVDKYRPMHADYTYDCRYGFRDYRGGGRSSARITVARVAAGAIAKKVLYMMHGMRVIGR
jgi:chorismate synthase